MDLEKDTKEEAQREAKRVVVIEQMPDDTFECTFIGLTARQQLLPMLRAAEKQFRINLNRKSIRMSIESGKCV